MVKGGPSEMVKGEWRWEGVEGPAMWVSRQGRAVAGESGGQRG